MRRIAKKFTQAAVLTAAAIGTTVAMSVPAHASGNDIYWASDYVNYALVGDAKFYSYGETLKVWDDDKDGHGAVGVVQLKHTDGTWFDYYWGYNGNGADTYKTFDLSIAEGRSLRLKVCLMDGAGGHPYSCGPYVYGTA